MKLHYLMMIIGLIGYSISACAFSHVESSPKFGTGLNRIADWSSELPFIDLMKQSREWLDLSKEPQQIATDEDGWVTSLEANQIVRSTFLISPEEYKDYIGNIYVFYEGKGKLRYFGSELVESHDGYDVIKGVGRHRTIDIISTDPKDYIRNIRIIPEQFLDAYKNGELFNPDWLKIVSQFDSLRFMDWMNTNHSTQQFWQNRPKISDRTWRPNGVPLEVMIILANQLKVAPWFNIPHLADGEYIEKFAKTIQQNLSKELIFYIEHSNEVWNRSFAQHKYAQQADPDWFNTTWLTDNKRMDQQWHGVRTAKICDIFKQQVFVTSPQRVNCVLALQTANKWAAKYAIECPAWKSAATPCYKHGIDYIAITTYFNGGLNGSWENKGDNPRNKLIAEWANSESTGIDNAFEQLFTGKHFKDIDEGMHAFKGVKEKLNTSLENWKHLIAPYNLSLVVYEGGQHISASSNSLRENPAVIAFYTELNRDPRMELLYTQLVEVWRKQVNQLHTFYLDIGQSSKWGSWGMLEHVNQKTSPKYKAISKAINQNHPNNGKVSDEDH